MTREAARILMVDDRHENLLALEAVLEPLGHELVRASSGPDALRELLSGAFAVILMDVEMPLMDGYETATRIKEREKTRHVPIVFLTAHQTDAQQQFRGYEAGAVDYLLKPFDPTILRSKVQVFADLFHLKRDAELLAHRAVHDALTGLPNRVLLMDRLAVALAQVERRTSQVAVVFIDLDGFKLVNDTRGHEAGDELLMEAAGRLRHVVRPADTVARFGGDEFAIVAEVADEADALVIAERLSVALAAPFKLRSGDAFVSASVGIALARGREDNPETLVREADAAMYRAKQRGGAGHDLYDASMRDRAARRLDTERALGEALERDELRLVYQPMVDLRTGALTGLEALLRWEHPEHGLMEPADFLALAEETWQIVPIGKWVLEQALGQGVLWRAQTGGKLVPISVNVSGRQVSRPHFAATVAAALAATDTEPGMLSLEVTESAVGEARATLLTLARLREGGVRLLLDDFGTGVASLSALTRYPVDTLKVDRSLVESVHQRSRDSAIVAAILGLGHGLGLAAVAEGIERPEQVTALRALGCQVGQGNYFAPALPAEDILGFLSTQSSEPFAERVEGAITLTERAAA